MAESGAPITSTTRPSSRTARKQKQQKEDEDNSYEKIEENISIIDESFYMHETITHGEGIMIEGMDDDEIKVRFKGNPVRKTMKGKKEERERNEEKEKEGKEEEMKTPKDSRIQKNLPKLKPIRVTKTISLRKMKEKGKLSESFERKKNYGEI